MSQSPSSILHPILRVSFAILPASDLPPLCLCSRGESCGESGRCMRRRLNKYRYGREKLQFMSVMVSSNEDVRTVGHVGGMSCVLMVMWKVWKVMREWFWRYVCTYVVYERKVVWAERACRRRSILIWVEYLKSCWGCIYLLFSELMAMSYGERERERERGREREWVSEWVRVCESVCECVSVCVCVCMWFAYSFLDPLKFSYWKVPEWCRGGAWNIQGVT